MLQERHVGGRERRRACAANSAHERLMQQEQLSSIVSLHISSVPHFASQCVSSKKAREGSMEGSMEGNKQTRK